VATKVQKSVRERAIEFKQELTALNRELVPVLRELRQRFNELVDEHNQLQDDFDALDIQAYAYVQDEGLVLPQQDIINFTGGGISAADDAGNARTNVTVALGAGVLFGTTTQIPYMNAGGTNFIYDSEFTYDGAGIKLTNASRYIQLATTDPSTTGEIRFGSQWSVYAESTDIHMMSWNSARLSIGDDLGAGPQIGQITLFATSDLNIGCTDNGQGIQFVPGGGTTTYAATEHNFSSQSGTGYVYWQSSIGGALFVSNATNHELGMYPDPNNATGGSLTVLGTDMENDGAGSGTGGALVLRAGDNNRVGNTQVGGAVTLRGGDAEDTGGNCTIRPGTGTAQGVLDLQNGAGTSRFKVNSTGIGFFNVGPVARASAYTPTNVTTDRSYDANATTVDELADVLGTLIADLQAYGLLQ
jgi:hypothetical protein